MTYSEMLHYTFMSILFTQIRGGDLDFELTEMIRTGQLSNYLVRPVGVVEFAYIRGIAPKLLIAGILPHPRRLLRSVVGSKPLPNYRRDVLSTFREHHSLPDQRSSCRGSLHLGRSFFDAHGEKHAREFSFAENSSL